MYDPEIVRDEPKKQVEFFPDLDLELARSWYDFYDPKMANKLKSFISCTILLVKKFLPFPISTVDSTSGLASARVACDSCPMSPGSCRKRSPMRWLPKKGWLVKAVKAEWWLFFFKGMLGGSFHDLDIRWYKWLITLVIVNSRTKMHFHDLDTSVFFFFAGSWLISPPN